MKDHKPFLFHRVLPGLADRPGRLRDILANLDALELNPWPDNLCQGSIQAFKLIEPIKAVRKLCLNEGSESIHKAHAIRAGKPEAISVEEFDPGLASPGGEEPLGCLVNESLIRPPLRQGAPPAGGLGPLRRGTESGPLKVANLPHLPV